MTSRRESDFDVPSRYRSSSGVPWQKVIPSRIAENVGMVIGFMPMAGISLPFLSYGGSSIMAAFTVMGLAISVRRRRFVN